MVAVGGGVTTRLVSLLNDPRNGDSMVSLTIADVVLVKFSVAHALRLALLLVSSRL